jgi:hypothetical protein
MSNAHAQITLEVSASISLSVEAKAKLEARLRSTLQSAIRNQLAVEGGSEAWLFQCAVTVDRQNMEDEIANYLDAQIQDGHLDAEGMGRRLALYGLQLPSDFMEEIQERADMSESE